MALLNRDTARKSIEQFLSQLPAGAVVELTSTGQMPSDQPSRASLKVRIELTSPLPDQLETAADISLPAGRRQENRGTTRLQTASRQGRKRKPACKPQVGRHRKAGDEDIH